MKFKKMKKLFIGSSSPVGYYYAKWVEKGRPAPILESPLSYLLLYDEIWFLSRKLCPYNMEYLDFVHFVDEDLCPEGLTLDAIPKADQREFVSFPQKAWKSAIKETIGLRWKYDNHSRTFKFGEINITPTPGRYENILIDKYISTKFDMDLVANTANIIWTKEFDQNQLKLTISERLFKNKVTSLQTIDGPWHPMINELRNESLLKNFRNKIESIPNINELKEVNEKVSYLSDEFEKEMMKLIEKNYETMSLGKSSLMFLLGFIPSVGNTIGTLGLLKEITDKINERREYGWVGFFGKAISKIKKS